MAGSETELVLSTSKLIKTESSCLTSGSVMLSAKQGNSNKDEFEASLATNIPNQYINRARNSSTKHISERHGATECRSRMTNSNSTESRLPPLSGGESFQGRSLGLKCAGEAQSKDGQLVQIEVLDACTQPENVHSQVWTDIIQCIPSPLSVHLPTQEPQLVSSPKTTASQSRREPQTASVQLPTGQDLECDYVADERRSEVRTCTQMQDSRKPIHGDAKEHTNMNGSTGTEAKLDHFMNVQSDKRQNTGRSSARKQKKVPDGENVLTTSPTLSVLSYFSSKSDGLLTCEICEEEFVATAALEKHLQVHMAVWKVKCSVCDKRFTDKKYLLAHMISHGAEKPFECDICHASFAYPDTLKKHKKRKHIEGRRRCKECHRIYEYGEYEKHAKQYHSEDPLERNKPYECDICFLRFRMPAILQNHKFTHSNEKTYLCAECGKTFRTAQARQSHSKMHSDKHVAEKMKKVPCKICKKEYFKHCMRQHEKLHNLERKFMCEKCGKTFLMKHHLHNHEKSHLDEKPHVCEICDTSFRLAHHLRAHRKTHKATNKNK